MRRLGGAEEGAPRRYEASVGTAPGHGHLFRQTATCGQPAGSGRGMRRNAIGVSVRNFSSKRHGTVVFTRKDPDGGHDQKGLESGNSKASAAPQEGCTADNVLEGIRPP